MSNISAEADSYTASDSVDVVPAGCNSVGDLVGDGISAYAADLGVVGGCASSKVAEAV